MGLFDQFPYTNFHELNLDWLLKMMKELYNTVENFVALNTIKYADPIQWNITTQYEANTVVVDPQTGTAYISSKAVPSGVALTNTDYWSIIFTLDIISANKNITLRDDGSNVLATFASAAGDWLLWNGTLYKVSQAINTNEAYVVGYNLDRYTVELFIKEYISDLSNSINTIIGDLDDLTTSDNDSIVDAINSLLSDLSNSITTLNNNVGELDDLDTTDQTSIVNAINEVNTKTSNIKLSFKTVSAMIASTDITVGDVYRCDGYYAAGDHGFGFWYAQATADTNYSVQAANGVYLVPIPIEGRINIYQFGAHGNDTDDDQAIIQNAFNYCCDHKIALYIDEGTFAIHEAITITQRQFTIVGAGMERTNIHRVSSEGLYNYVFRFTGSLQWGFSISDMSLYNDGGGACIYCSDGTSGGDIYHAQFRNLQLLAAAYGFMVPDAATTTPWWGSEFDNIIFSQISIQCIHMGGSSVGIPNNSYRHITTYSCGSNGGANAQFYIKGYNQVLENIEILSPRQPLLELLSGGNAVINGLKCESLEQGSTNHPLFKLVDYAQIKATEISIAGDFTKVSAIFAYSGSQWCRFDIDILRVGIRAGTSMAVPQICNTSKIFGSIGNIFNIISTNPLPYSWTNDINVKLRSINNNRCIGLSADDTIDPLEVSCVRSAASITVNVNITSDDQNRYASNMDITFAAVSTNTITVNLDGVLVGTVTNDTKRLIVQGGYGYLV